MLDINKLNKTERKTLMKIQKLIDLEKEKNILVKRVNGLYSSINHLGEKRINDFKKLCRNKIK